MVPIVEALYRASSSRIRDMQFYEFSSKIVTAVFSKKVTFYKKTKNLSNFWSTFAEKYDTYHLSKIAQSGHTVQVSL